PPEDQDAQKHAAKIVGVGDRGAEELAQHHRHEDVQRDQADEHRRQPLDRADHAVGEVLLFHASLSRHRSAQPRPNGKRRYSAALYLARLALSESITFFGSCPTFLTPSPHCASPGATAWRHALSWSGVSL